MYGVTLSHTRNCSSHLSAMTISDRPEGLRLGSPANKYLVPRPSDMDCPVSGNCRFGLRLFDGWSCCGCCWKVAGMAGFRTGDGRRTFLTPSWYMDPDRVVTTVAGWSL